jgi:hypothetical protein
VNKSRGLGFQGLTFDVFPRDHQCRAWLDPCATWVEGDPCWSATHRPLSEKICGRATTVGCETSPSCGSASPSMSTQTLLHTIAGMHAMKGTIEKPLNGGAFTHRWAHTPARGPAVAWEVFLTSLLKSGTVARSLWYIREREKGEERNVGAMVP